MKEDPVAPSPIEIESRRMAAKSFTHNRYPLVPIILTGSMAKVIRLDQISFAEDHNGEPKHNVHHIIPISLMGVIRKFALPDVIYNLLCSNPDHF